MWRLYTACKGLLASEKTYLVCYNYIYVKSVIGSIWELFRIENSCVLLEKLEMFCIYAEK